MTENKVSKKNKRLKRRDELQKKVSRIPVLRLLVHNFWRKALSLAFAIILWTVVMTQKNPTRTKVIYDVPVELTGIEMLNSRGLSLSTDNVDIPSNVDVYLNVPMDDLRRVNEDNVTASIDFSRVTAVGAHTLRIVLDSAYGAASSATVSEVTVEVEQLITSVVPVKLSYTGALSENYRMGKAIISPSQFQITGPETEVNRVAAALVNVDLSNQQNDFTRSVVYSLVDINDEPIEDEHISSSIGNSVSVNVPISPTKSLPVVYNNCIVGIPESGYYVDNVTILPEEVVIAAPQSTLESLDSISVAAIQIDGANKTISQMIPLRFPTDLTWKEITEVNVVVAIKEVEETKRFIGIPVTARNLASGLSAELYNATVDIDVTMGGKALQSLTSDQIQVYVDLNGYTVMSDTPVPLNVEIHSEAISRSYKLSQEKTVLKITRSTK